LRKLVLFCCRGTMSKIIHLADHAKQGAKDGDSAAGEDAGPAVPKELPAAARRALEEAEERRRAAKAEADRASKTREINGRGGLDPVRYGDWEVKGIISDF